VALAFAVLMSRKMPAASQQLDEKAPPSRGSTTNEPPRPAATIPADFPAANQIVDVSALSAGVCRLYWLAASAKFGAVTLALGILSRNNDPQSGSFQFTWGMGIVAGAGVLLALSIAFTLQEDWIRPGAALALGLGLISAICFVPVSFTMDPRVQRWGAQKVPFEEFLRTRLETYGDVLMINETPCRANEEPREHEASIVVMPSETEKRRARAKATGASRTRSPHS